MLAVKVLASLALAVGVQADYFIDCQIGSEKAKVEAAITEASQMAMSMLPLSCAYSIGITGN